MILTPILLFGAFLVGSLPFSYWLARSAVGTDLRRVGSSNPGATNALRVAGWLAAAPALVLDVAKGALVVVIGVWMADETWIVGAMAVAAVTGHVFSPWLRFRGGKGVATSIGALSVLNPLATLSGVLIFLALVAWKRYVSLGSVVALPVIVLVWFVGDQWIAGHKLGEPGLFAAIALAGIVLMRHLSNIRRLWSRREPRLGE